MYLSVAEAGADRTGERVATEVIQGCIDRAAESGEVVVFPKGRYLSGGLELRSGVTMEFLAGSELAGVPEEEAYPRKTVWKAEGKSLPHCALLLGEDVEDVTLRGAGTLNGQGGLFPGGAERKSQRPMVLNFRNSRRIRVEGLRLKDSGMWMQSYERCEGVWLRGLEVDNVSSHCNDGLDIVSCRDVVISDCRIAADDDGICFKTLEDVPCEHVVVSNCLISSHCNGIKFGTESNGDMRDVSVSNCVIFPHAAGRKVYWGVEEGCGGIVIGSVDGAVVENISFSNIAIRGTRCPVFMRLGNRGKVRGGGRRKGPGAIRNIRFHGISVTGGGDHGLEATAIPGTEIENVTVSDFDFEFVGGGPKERAWAAPLPVPEVDPAAYPDSGLHGVPPSWGLFARRVRGLHLRNGVFRHAGVESRPAVVADGVHGLELTHVKFPDDEGNPVREITQGEGRPKAVYGPEMNPRLAARYIA